MALSSSPAAAHSEGLTGRADAHAPIGVMRDHTHKKGEAMFSYRYSIMRMEGMRSGTTNLSTSDVLASYMATRDRPLHPRRYVGCGE
ncbi:MAG: hypothetical protein ACPG80_00440 [Rickettsiales bacterium]